MAKKIKPNFYFVDKVDREEILKKLELCGREAYQSQHKIEPGSAEKFVKLINKRKHHSVLEHVNITIHFDIDRGVAFESVRHRHTSPTQESTRYCNYAADTGGYDGNMTVIDLTTGVEMCKITSALSAEKKAEILRIWWEQVLSSEKAYNEMIELGASPQIARSVLINSLKAGIVITANLREWKHILSLRTPDDAHPQMREVMIRLLRYFQKILPEIFGDLEVDKVALGKILRHNKVLTMSEMHSTITFYGSENTTYVNNSLATIKPIGEHMIGIASAFTLASEEDIFKDRLRKIKVGEILLIDGVYYETVEPPLDEANINSSAISFSVNKIEPHEYVLNSKPTSAHFSEVDKDGERMISVALEASDEFKHLKIDDIVYINDEQYQLKSVMSAEKERAYTGIFKLINAK